MLIKKEPQLIIKNTNKKFCIKMSGFIIENHKLNEVKRKEVSYRTSIKNNNS